MKLYTSIGPNPHTVRMFIAEKGLTIPTEPVDLMAGENRQDAHLKRNPFGQTPALELDDGTYLTEITAICEYLDEKHPTPPLIGMTAEERAETRMWVRRIDLNICEPMTNGFRSSEGLALFKDRVRTIPEAAPGLKATAQDWLKKLDGWMTGQDYVVGSRLTLADILLFCFLDFGGAVGQPIDPAFKTITAWHARMKARPSAKA